MAHQGPVQVLSVKLPTGDGVYCGVTLEPYVLIKRGEAVLAGDDVPEEGAPEGPVQLRSRWYRSTIPRGGAVCSIHPEREAGVQCLVCVRIRVPQHLGYHCSVDCLRQHWPLHKDYHKNQANGEGGGHRASRTGCGRGLCIDGLGLARATAWEVTSGTQGVRGTWRCLHVGGEGGHMRGML